jgi:hypothetical protein
MPTNITTPVGRLVQGSLYDPQEKDQAGRPMTVKSGPNAGQPTKKWFFALAIQKSDPGWPAFWAALSTEARAGFPTLFDPQGNCRRPDFAWKIVDGDSTVPNQNNKRPVDQEGFAGCYVIRFSSGFAPRCYDNANTPLDPATVQIKLGSYVRVACSISANGDAAKPGLYVNPSLVQLCGYGPEIVTGPNAADAFAQPVSLPQGASATPPAPAHAMPGGQPPAAPGGYGQPPAPPAGYGQPPAPPAAPGGYGAPAAPGGYGPPPAPQAAPAGYGAPAAPGGYGQPPAAPLAAPAPAPAYGFAAGAPEPQYWVNGAWAQESALRASGYTDAHLQGLPRQ